MTNHEQLLTTWTSLRTKLGKLISLSKHKELLKEALETHLNQSSSFLSSYAEPRWDLATEVYDYNQLPELVNLSEAEKEQLTPEAKKQIVYRAYQLQKEKNEQIVRECKELLEKLFR